MEFLVGLVVGIIIGVALKAWQAGKFKDGVQLSDFTS